MGNDPTSASALSVSRSATAKCDARSRERVAGPLEILARLRKEYPSATSWWPVDAEYHKAKGTDPRFEVCVGAILTQNTAWANVERALANLKAADLLDAKRLSKAEPRAIEEAVRPTGYYRQKTEYLRGFARYVANLPKGLDELFRGDAKKVRKTLLSFNGIGEETADDMLVYAGKIPSFVVDAYTRRLTKRLGFGTGEESYAELQRLWGRRLDQSAKSFGEAHALIVEHAKIRCTAKLPRCPGCPLETVCAQVDVDPEVFKRLPST